MGLSEGRKSFRIGLAVLIQYRSVSASQPASHVAVAITLNALAKASSLKTNRIPIFTTTESVILLYTVLGCISLNLGHYTVVLMLPNVSSTKRLIVFWIKLGVLTLRKLFCTLLRPNVRRCAPIFAGSPVIINSMVNVTDTMSMSMGVDPQEKVGDRIEARMSPLLIPPLPSPPSPALRSRPR